MCACYISLLPRMIKLVNALSLPFVTETIKGMLVQNKVCFKLLININIKIKKTNNKLEKANHLVQNSKRVFILLEGRSIFDP